MTQSAPRLVPVIEAGNAGPRSPREGRSEMGNAGLDTQPPGVLGVFARDSFLRIGANPGAAG
jgi:hypothetical protein